jgi:hypothetical protein
MSAMINVVEDFLVVAIWVFGYLFHNKRVLQLTQIIAVFLLKQINFNDISLKFLS